ncbi:MAG: RDD family protein [Syntrophorhabdales bacterium]|jgi:uncharacterized RDD family membrane protein YckC
MSNSVTLRTPEGVAFALLPAGPIARFVAWAVDLAVVSTAVLAAETTLTLFSLVSPDAGRAAGIISFFVVSLGYAMVCEWRYKGQTIGKRLLSIRVVDAEGMKLQPGQIIIRNILRAIDSLPLCYMVGAISCIASRKSQRLGDIAANTMVIREPKVQKPDLEQLKSHKYNSLKAYPLLAARLRQRTSQAEADIALQALVRRDSLDPMARVELFREIAARFKEGLDFPEEASMGISDEQIVRDVVEILFTSARPASRSA